MIFDAFEMVLVELDSSGNDQHGAGWESLVEGSLIDLAGYYGNQNLRNPNRDLVNYSGLATQAAYIYMYAIGRAEFTYQLLKKFRKNQGKPLFNSGNLNVTSIGGGPVSELVGLIKYLETPDFGEGVNKIVYDVLDKESDWEDVAYLVVDAISTKIDISLNFYQCDLSIRNGLHDNSVEYDDLVILSFFISEICELPHPKYVRENLLELIGKMKRGSKLFYNDSDAYSFYMYMNNLSHPIKGLNQIAEIQDVIVFDYADPGETYLRYAQIFDRIPHLSSKAVAKFYERI